MGKGTVGSGSAHAGTAGGQNRIVGLRRKARQPSIEECQDIKELVADAYRRFWAKRGGAPRATRRID